jgi:hypothetical protein
MITPKRQPGRIWEKVNPVPGASLEPLPTAFVSGKNFSCAPGDFFMSPIPDREGINAFSFLGSQGADCNKKATRSYNPGVRRLQLANHHDPDPAVVHRRVVGERADLGRDRCEQSRDLIDRLAQIVGREHPEGDGRHRKFAAPASSSLPAPSM